jgi:TolB protein
LFAALPPLNPESPNFEDWRSVGANVLVVTRAQVTGGELAVEVRGFFVDGKQVMLSKRYSGRADNPRSFAHQASDDIVALTQYRGVARTKIAFTSDRDATKPPRGKELYIVDYDGFNAKRITVNNSLNILPAWSPDGRSLAYTSYRQGSPAIFVARIFEGRSDNLTKNEGQAFAPTFSPDGKRLAYASNKSGNMEIWVANADGTGAHRVTSSQGSDTAPTWSPTGQEIAFTSDRAGSPQIYLMDSEGLNVRRLTTVGNWNDAPAWNPSKEYSEIAYTSRLEVGGPVSFDIAVIDLATRQVRQVTSGRGSCEYPSWAPNGRHLVFSCKRGNTWQITVSDREGRTIDTLSAGPGNNVQPDWGP